MDGSARRILILGLAREGASLARYFALRACPVTVTDSAPPERLADRLRSLPDLHIQVVLGGHYPELVAEADDFFVSPGVSENNAVYAAARRAGLRIQSMTTLFFDLCPGPIIGITGSSGKTTTTGLIGHLLQTAGVESVLGGNIGTPMLDLLPNIGRETQVVLELSSFQLELMRRSPHIAVVTNISPNHLDRHGTMDDYLAAKRHIIEHQSAEDFAVLNADDPTTPYFRQATPAAIRLFSGRSKVAHGAVSQNRQIGLIRDGVFTAVLSVDDVPLLGAHNVENVLAAVTVAGILGVEPGEMARAIRTFRTAPHRLETVARIGGVTFVDDSIATSPARAVVAMRAIQTPIILIAGGRDKNLPWVEFAELAVRRVRVLILLGEAASMIEQAVCQALERQAGPSLEMIRHCPSIEDAVDTAAALSRPGDTVLLAPGCTSYDMFENFEERGAIFARSVGALRAA